MSLFVLILGIVSIVVAVTSLAARPYTRGESVSPPREWPPVMLFVPCCGDEEGLADNLKALASQDYPRLDVCFVVERDDDRAIPAIEKAGGNFVVAGAAKKRGQKIHNLLTAIDRAGGGSSAVWAFADSDGRPDAKWLRRLVAPLADDAVGVASTYRFYVPEPASFPNLLRSVWNASVLSLLGEHERNFAWGGGMAIRRDVFERVGVREAWSGALSDDYALTHAVRRAGLKVKFVPECIVPAYGRTAFFELASWVTRQIKITRVYWPALFWKAAVYQTIYSAFLVLGPWAGGRLALALWAAVVLMGAWTGFVRARSYPWARSYAWAFATLFPVASFLTLQAVVRALVSRRIEWRGRVYEMRSPTETVIVR